MRYKTFSILLAALIAITLPAVTQAQEWQTNGNHIYNTNSGRVGIGTQNPVEKLHVQGDAQIESAAGAELNLLNTTSGSTWQVVSGVNGGFEVGYVDGGLTDASAPFFIAVTGRVGLGTVSPSEKLTVEGNLKVNGNIVSDGDICIGSGCP